MCLAYFFSVFYFPAFFILMSCAITMRISQVGGWMAYLPSISLATDGVVFDFRLVLLLPAGGFLLLYIYSFLLMRLWATGDVSMIHTNTA